MSIDPAVAYLVLGCVALLFAAAAVHKLRDLRRFDEIFSAYGLLPAPRGLGLSRAVPLLEILVAAGLLFGRSRAIAAVVGIGLLLLYGLAIAVNLRRGRRDLACGCGGPDDRRPIAPWMVWRNLFVAAALGTVLLPATARELELTDMLTIGLGTACCAVVYLCVDRLLANIGRSGVGVHS